jgi:hypothetical protein
MRAATSGEKDIVNCHPVYTTEGVWMMHNGIIRIPELNKKWSDTKHFAEFCVKPLLLTYPHLFGTEMLGGMLSYFIGSGNKLLLMNGEGKTQIVNQKEGTDKEGIWLSNVYSVEGWGSYGYWGAEGDYDDSLWLKRSQYRSGWNGVDSATEGTTKLLPTSTTVTKKDVPVFKMCGLCKVTLAQMDSDWDYVPGVGYVCMMCQAEIEKDVEAMGNLNMENLITLPYNELKDLCENEPETVAWIIMNEFGEGS